ncbi:uncharacterized protein TNCV_1476841 [Trichonephila clavipes]|nr:uncharacterized protein TNCV_1476841 [Trichonephila clavipes]
MLSDTRSSIQHLSEWWRHGDRTTTSIVHLLNNLIVNVKIFFQWVPSHVNVCENEIIDYFTREGSHKDTTYGGCLTFSDIATRVKQDVSSSWKQAPVHERYEGNHPGAALLGAGSRRDETTLSRFRSGHTRDQRYVAGPKVYSPYPNCNVTQATPDHVLACIGWLP